MNHVILPLVTFLFGLLAIYGGIRVRRDTRAKSPWPRTDGVLLKRDIKYSTSPGDGPVYEPDIEYRYRVADREYTGTQMFSGRGEAYDASTMRRKIKALPDHPTVHYNPQNPAESYLVLTAAWWWWLSISFGVMAAFGGGVLTLARLARGG